MNTPRRRVLFIISSLRFGGMEKHTISLLNGLDTDQFELSLATLRRENALLGQLHRERLAHHVELDAKGKLDMAAAGRLRQFLQAHPQDIVVCVNEYPMLYAWLALRTLPKPRLVDIFHTTIYRSFKERMQLKLYRRLFRRMDLLVYVSRKQQDYWHARGLHVARDVVIPNGIDAHRFTALRDFDRDAFRARWGLGPQDYVITICAALRPEKAHGDMIEAIGQLRREGVAIKALFIGDGPERGALERQRSALALDRDVIITGLQDDVRPFLECSDVCALTSHSIETFSVAALEAMAMGKPLVMTRIGGAEEQVADAVNGFLYEPGDIPALVGHLRALSDPALRHRLGEAGAALLREQFTESLMLQRYARAFLELPIAR